MGAILRGFMEIVPVVLARCIRTTVDRAGTRIRPYKNIVHNERRRTFAFK